MRRKNTSELSKNIPKTPLKVKRLMKKVLPAAEAALSITLLANILPGCEKSYSRRSCGDVYEDLVRDRPTNEGDEVTVGGITVRLTEMTDTEIKYDFLCAGEVMSSNSRSRDFFYDPEATVALQTDFEGFTVLILHENADFENKKVDLTVIVSPAD